MTSSKNDAVTIVTSDSERAPWITYKGIIISELLTLALYIKCKKNWQCIMTSSTNDDVIIMT